MANHERPYLRLVWPPQHAEDDPIQEYIDALTADGWREVTVEDVSRFPPNWAGVVIGEILAGVLRFWAKPLAPA